VLRKLSQLGALPIKNSAYLLPYSADHLEDFQWVKSEIVAGGGGAWIFSVALESLSDSEIQDRFRELRSEDYKQLLDAANADPQEWPKLKRKFESILEIDFFDAPGRKEVESFMQSIEQQLRNGNARTTTKPDLKNVTGATWVTRKGVKVDRISSAWLIRRFIDPSAKFLFVDENQYATAPGHVRFDMFEGEFTHEGDMCTFEVLLAHSSRSDPALEAIAQMVHDIDVKDEKFQRRETSGFAAIISGIIALHKDDEQRIAEGGRLLEATYAALKAGRV